MKVYKRTKSSSSTTQRNYTDSEVADRMLQLGIIKKNILRKNFSPRYEMKILN